MLAAMPAASHAPRIPKPSAAQAADLLPDAPADAPAQRLTIRDVAALARVSVATVSRYVNGKQRFTPEVERRITDAISSTGYHAHPVARSLSTGRSGAVAALVSGVGSPQAAALVKGMCRVALAGGHDLICVDPLNGDSPLRELDRVLAMQVDGLVLAAHMPPEAAARLAGQSRPVVDLTPSADPANGHYAQAAAGALLARHLVAAGHQRFAFLACADEADSAARLLGVQEALQDAGLPPATVHEALGATAADGAKAASSVLLARARPQAVIACNDPLAMGLLSEARRLGIAVPEQVSVAGIGNMPFGRYLSPPLCSVELHADSLGAAAMTRLLAAVRDQVSATEMTAAGALPWPVIEPQLVLRGSTRRLSPTQSAAD